MHSIIILLHILQKMPRLNPKLEDALEETFKPLGIVAFSRCCRWRCTGSYDEYNDEFQVRDIGGIFYIKLYTNGMNYNPVVRVCCAQYDSFEYLMGHWEEELSLIAQWCGIVGLNESEYDVTKPGCFDEAIIIAFKRPLQLDPTPGNKEELLERYNVPPMKSFAAAPFGTLLGTALGSVPVFSCHYDDGRGPLGSIPDSVAEAEESTVQVQGQTLFCGLRWQCVEFARRWLILTRGVRFGGVDFASEIFDLPELVDVATCASAPWRAVHNGSACTSSGRPVVGALLIWDKQGAFEHTGHVAVITEVTDAAVRIAEQNYRHVPWPEGQNYSRELLLSAEPVSPSSPEHADLEAPVMKFTVTDPDSQLGGTCIKGWKIIPDGLPRSASAAKCIEKA